MAGEIDAPYVGALAGLHEVIKADLALFLVHFRQRLHFRKGVADVGQRRFDAVGAFGGFLA